MNLMLTSFQAANAVPDQVAISAWDPTMFMVDTLRRVGLDASSTKIRDAMIGAKGWVGVNGAVRLQCVRAARHRTSRDRHGSLGHQTRRLRTREPSRRPAACARRKRCRQRTAARAALFQPLSVRGLTVRNRIVMSPMNRNASPGGVPGEDMAQYYRRRVDGEAGLIVTGGIGVDHPAATGVYVDARVCDFRCCTAKRR